ncbi:serine/threonine protein kinase [Haloactinospora alba]|uniref:Serine/threonine protein kinase n=1 Tax=Haloactinospora alba TaxID=405555 RepID=A0A543NGC5_9ACTN|nr:serine/threonine-protein kinase [Haloactinospora alba]TQN30907.1 serine/threonine protein kinase [Haloactinospora alba]
MSTTADGPDGFPTPGVAPRSDNDPRYVGDFRVVGRLGAGGMGVVYAAVDNDGTPVAVKVVHQEYAVDAEFRSRFSREVNLLRRVAGTCVPGLVAADTEARRPWLTTEYVPGPTLNRNVREYGPLAGDTLLGLAAGVAEALQAVHAAGIVHRDLKPGNVVLSPSGPKVLDFGIARAAEESAITRTSGLMGTPGWLAPEQYDGADPDPRSDVFAWGGLVAFAATGRRPFGSGSPEAVAFRTVREAPDLDGLPEQLRPVVSAALSKNPAARPSAGEALSAVTQVWTGVPETAPAEATRTLPSLLDARWSGGRPEPSTAAWESLAPPRRTRRGTTRLLAWGAAGLALVVATGAAITAVTTDAGPFGGGTNGGGGGGGSPTASGGGGSEPDQPGPRELEHGGANLRGGDPEEDLGIGAVRTENTAPDTLELATSEALGQGDAVSGQWEPRLRMVFSAARREGSDIVFDGTAEYLRDKGSYTLHTRDFVVTEFRRTSEDIQHLDDPEWKNFYNSAEEEVLATLDADTPTADFTLTVTGVPEENPQGDVRYLHYITPERLWGYDVTEEDRTLGDVCYTEGPDWHDLPMGPDGTACG